MTKVKVCGLMRLEDIAYVNAYRPDYIGFVFAKSRRQIEPEWAKGLRMFLDPEIQVTGVFVNEKPDEVLRLCEEHVIDVIQLHGEEDEAYLEYLKARVQNPVIKALRVKDQETVQRAQKLPCDYLLLDTYTKDAYGGSGKTFDLSLIPGMEKPFFLAGGLTPENVAEKVSTCQPYCVDVSSGVEGSDGWKDIDKIRMFVENVREER